MYPQIEVGEYAELLQCINKNREEFQGGERDEILHLMKYRVGFQGGGKDGIPYFKFVKNVIDGTLIIWVRGTRFTCFNDILINIHAKPIPFYNGTCHEGYFNAAMKIIESFKNYIGENDVNKLVCLGHSLGGAISSIIAIILNKGDDRNHLIQGINSFKSKIGNVHAFVYGTPPTFSTEISDESTNYITNTILKNDVIPKLSSQFNTLAKLHQRIVTIRMYHAGAYNRSQNAENAFNEAINLNNANFTYDDKNADKLPGSVFIIDRETKNIINGGNHRNIVHIHDILGIFEHRFVHYLEIIRIINGIIILHIKKKKSVVKKAAFFVGGAIATGVAAYLSFGAAVAYGVITAIASS